MKTYSLNLPEDLMKRIDKLAKKEDRSRSKMVTLILKKEIENGKDIKKNSSRFAG